MKLLFGSDSKGVPPAKQQRAAIGEKAIGLLHHPRLSIPRFWILDAKSCSGWRKKTPRSKMESLVELSEQIQAVGIVRAIVRISASEEGIAERGKYESRATGIRPHELAASLEDILSDFDLRRSEGTTGAVIVQEFIEPVLKGHLSNERRVSRTGKKFKAELLNSTDELEQSRTIEATSDGSITLIDFACSNRHSLLQSLRTLCSHLATSDHRFHIEWVWNGVQLHVVQVDEEQQMPPGTPPNHEWQRRQVSPVSPHGLKFLRTQDNCGVRWKKIECVKAFKKAQLPHGEIYVIEGRMRIEALLSPLPDDIKDELQWLVKAPIVVRTEIAGSKRTSDGFMLPRTDTIRSVAQIVAFVKRVTKQFKKEGLTPADFCFLAHRFIVSRSCALAFAKPNIPRVRIDSTWGIVEGLYYFPHDSFEVNLESDKIKSKQRCKYEYVDIRASGEWYRKQAGTSWDWKQSLTAKELKLIAKYTEQLTSDIGKPLTVMFFVGVDPGSGYPSLLPWFFTTEEIPQAGAPLLDAFSSLRGRSVTLGSMADMEKMELYGDDLLKGRTVKIKLDTDLVRDRDILNRLAELSKTKGFIVELEGSILAHAFYILTKAGARVRFIDKFEPTYEKQKFYKLVRDKIPVQIRLRGETVSTQKLDSTDVVRWLRGKLIEEAYELYWENDEDRLIGEVADVLEVLKAVAKSYGVSLKEADAIANRKEQSRGGFLEGVVLGETKQQSLIDAEVKTSERTGVFDLDIDSSAGRAPLHRIVSITHRDHDRFALRIPYAPALFIGSRSQIRREEHEVNLRGHRMVVVVMYEPSGITVRVQPHRKDARGGGQIDLFENSKDKQGG